MKFLAVIVLLFVVLNSDLNACTGITMKVKGKKAIFARTLEFGKGVLKYQVSFIPRNHQFTGKTPDGKPGMKWKGKYAHVGFTPQKGIEIFSGLNEKGLTYDGFYLPGYTEYQKYTPDKSNKTIAPVELGSWILSNFSSVKEIRNNIDKVLVAPVILEQLNFVPPMHSMIVDKEGNSIVIEYIKGKAVIFDNTLGVITNAPNFDWHITNVKNYINLRAADAKPVVIDGVKFKGLGCGSGGLGLPGDLTPPSRFIRALFMSNSSIECSNEKQTVLHAFHILNNFDIPEGTVIEDFEGKIIPEVTEWTSASDINNLKFYFHLRNNRQIRVVDLKKLDLDAPKVKVFNLPKEENILDISKDFK